MILVMIGTSSRRKQMARIFTSLSLCCLLLSSGALSSAADAERVRQCRLLLGLTGMMNEAELHILKQRMYQGKLNKARRGELVVAVPVGYVKSPAGEVTLDPDEQVQEIVRLVFDQFDRQGTVHGVLRHLIACGIRMPLRRRGGPGRSAAPACAADGDVHGQP